MIRGAAAGFALTLLLTGCAGAKPAAPPDPNLSCDLKHGAIFVDSLKKLPPSIRAALRTAAGAMADRGEFFNAGDVVSKPAPFNRFIRGGGTGGYWFVWFEHGGFAYWHQVAIFAIDPNGRAHVIANQPAKQPDLCAETDRLLE